MSPDDIVGYQFKQSLRGYSIEEVDDLLDRLADQVERTEAELADLRRRLQDAEAQAAAARETEATLQRTLVVAQQAADRNLADADAAAEATRAAAAAEAERVREEATAEAERVRSDAQAEAQRVLDDAQREARRDVDAARGQVAETAREHERLLSEVIAHRDALRANLRGLEELTATAPAPAGARSSDPGAEPEVRSSVTEADAEAAEHTGGHGWAADEGPEEDVATSDTEGRATSWADPSDPPSSLRVRVHDDVDDGDARSGSEPHGGR